MNIKNSSMTGLILTLFSLSGGVSAFSLHEENGACPNGISWAGDQHLSVNIANAGTSSLALSAAVIGVAERVSQVGGQSFDYVLPYGIETSAYAAPGGGAPDGDGVNEVGLADLSAFGALGMGPSTVDLATCHITEADVFIDSNTTWDFSVPDDGLPADNCGTEECYFNADRKRCTNGGQLSACPNGPWSEYARPVILHELGHNLGIAHSDHSYSFMNYDVRPWTNRADEKRIEYLPDDREALRTLYPAATTEMDAAVTVTWFDNSPGNVSASGAATGKLLCAPSTGVNYSPSIFDAVCGVDAAGNSGSTDVCPGDYLYVRYGIANYGTESLTVDERLYFSTNTWLDTAAGSDKLSLTAPAASVLNSQSSYRKGRKYQVPSTVNFNTDYYPILFIDSGADYAGEESQQNNWIPLRGKIHIKPSSSC